MADLVALRERREQVIAQLSDAFARDLVDVDEFERRLSVAHSTVEPAELEKLVADLAGVSPSTALVPLPAASPDRVRDRATVARRERARRAPSPPLRAHGARTATSPGAAAQERRI